MYCKMTKKIYYLAKFPSGTLENTISILSNSVLGMTDHIFKSLRLYADESYGKSPQLILNNMIQNNETIFARVLPNTIPQASTSCQGQSSKEPSNPLKEGTSSSSIAQKLQFEDKENDSLASEIFETFTTTIAEESIKLHNEVERLSRSADYQMDITRTKDSKIEIVSDKKKAATGSKKDIKDLIGSNLVQIKSISIIRQCEPLGVEIDIDSSESSSPKNLELSSGPSKKANSPSKQERKSQSPSSSPSKRAKSTDSLSIAIESHLSIDYSDPTILEFLSKRLLSILSGRKTYMEQIHKFYRDYVIELNRFNNTIHNLNFVVNYLPVAEESFQTTYLKSLLSELINKSNQLLKKVESLVEDVKKEANVFEMTLQDIDIFEKKNIPTLSAKGESVLTISDIKKIEYRLKEICEEADGTVILEDGRKAILTNSSTEFDCLVKHFVKFLIITGILKLGDESGVDKDK